MNKIINTEIPVFIISFNRLSYLLNLLTWLEKYQFKNIHIIDNNSSFPQLLEYYEKCPYKVHRLKHNYGHLVLWESGLFDNLIKNNLFILTDCDVVPIDECPFDVLEYFLGILEKYPNFTKVGFSLKIDDLPDYYVFKGQVIEKESLFWKFPLGEGLYEASIDTTFALYKPGVSPKETKWWRSIRTDFPYMARHLPWYADTNKLSDEDLYYQKNVAETSSYWSITDLRILKEHNSKLQDEIFLLKKDLREIEKNYIAYKVKKYLKKTKVLINNYRDIK